MADGTLAEGSRTMKRVVIAWPGYTGYMGPCFKALSQICELRIYIEPSKYEQQFDASSMAGVEFRRVEAGRESAAVEDVRTFAPDLTMVCGWGTPMSSALARGRISGLKVLEFDMPWEWSFRKFAARWVLWPHLRHFDAAFVPGNRCARYARWLGFRGNRLALGANPSGWERFGETAFSSGEMPPGGFLFVGRFVAAKGLDVLLAAYAAYRQQSAEPWDLALVGCGDALPQKLPEGARVVGFVKPQDIPSVLRDHRCLVLPSRWEPWGVCAAEAMSAGLATILSSACGLVDDVRPTLTVSPGDADALAGAMLRVSGLPPEELKQEGARVRAAVEQFSAARWAQRVMGFLGEDGQS